MWGRYPNTSSLPDISNKSYHSEQRQNHRSYKKLENTELFNENFNFNTLDNRQRLMKAKQYESDDTQKDVRIRNSFQKSKVFRSDRELNQGANRDKITLQKIKDLDPDFNIEDLDKMRLKFKK